MFTDGNIPQIALAATYIARDNGSRETKFMNQTGENMIVVNDKRVVFNQNGKIVRVLGANETPPISKGERMGQALIADIIPPGKLGLGDAVQVKNANGSTEYFKAVNSDQRSVIKNPDGSTQIFGEEQLIPAYRATAFARGLDPDHYGRMSPRQFLKVMRGENSQLPNAIYIKQGDTYQKL